MYNICNKYLSYPFLFTGNWMRQGQWGLFGGDDMNNICIQYTYIYIHITCVLYTKKNSIPPFCNAASDFSELSYILHEGFFFFFRSFLKLWIEFIGISSVSYFLYRI